MGKRSGCLVILMIPFCWAVAAFFITAFALTSAIALLGAIVLLCQGRASDADAFARSCFHWLYHRK